MTAWAKCSMSARCPSLAVGVWGSTASLLCGAEASFIFIEFTSTIAKAIKLSLQY